MADTQFRLLRENAIRGLRDEIKWVQDHWAEVVEDGEMTRVEGVTSDAETKEVEIEEEAVTVEDEIASILYRNVVVDTVVCHRRDGLVMNINFNQPRDVRGLTSEGRRAWWEQSDSLTVGSLLCLVDASHRRTFLLVCDRVVASMEEEPQQSNTDYKSSTRLTPDLATDPHRATIKVRCAEELGYGDVANIFHNIDGRMKVLVEFPRVIPASFTPVLRCLQQAYKSGYVPLSGSVAPDDQAGHSVVAPPLYMTKPGIKLSLKSITEGTENGKDLEYTIAETFSTRTLEEMTALDHEQCTALVKCLSSEMTLIEGATGTGKSFLGVQLVKVLVDNRDVTAIGPILCVCYNNYSLDNFLERLINEGISNIVRIGTRSKSPIVQPFILRNAVRSIVMTPLERIQSRRARLGIAEQECIINDSIDHLLHPQDPKALKDFLQIHHPQIFDELFCGASGDATTPSNYNQEERRKDQVIEDWLSGCHGDNQQSLPHTTRPLDIIQRLSVSVLSISERSTLLSHWYSSMATMATSKICEATKHHAIERAAHSKLRQEQERRPLKEAHVIGITTTGVASHADMIRRLGAKVLICDDASNIPEAHFLSALLPGLEQVVLIGDSLQIRAEMQDQDSASPSQCGEEEPSADLSVFERLIEEGRVPVAKLERQWIQNDDDEVELESGATTPCSGPYVDLLS